MKPFPKVAGRKPYVQKRPETKATGDVLSALVYAVRDQLYRDEQKKYFHGQLKDVRHALTWAADWFNRRAIFVTADRYQEIMFGLINEIKGHGDTSGVKYWPRYLLTCIQRHFRCNAQEYNDEGKATRDAHAYTFEGKAAAAVVDRALKTLQGAPVATAVAPADAFIREMSAAHALVRSPGGKKKGTEAAKVVVEEPQKELFGDV
jgi:hypothetical protein